MRAEWIDAVKKSWEREQARPGLSIQRHQLPSTVRAVWDGYDQEARASGKKAGASRFAVEGKNVFALLGPSAEGVRVHLCDSTGQLVATGLTDEEGVTHWIGRN